MDLTGNSTVVTDWEVDPETEVVTVTFRNGSGGLLGDVSLEKSKIRSMIEALAEVAKDISPDLEPRQGHRTNYDRGTLRAKTEFNS